MSGLRPQGTSLDQAETRARAIAKVTRPALPWREVYDVETPGVAVHRAIAENA